MLNRRAPLGGLVTLALALAGCGVVDNLVGSHELAVQRFVADPPEVGSGAAVTLSWDVAGADTVEIDNGVGQVEGRGHLQVRPTTSTRYVLVARKGSEQVTSLVSVNVVSPAASPSPLPTPSPTPTPTPTPKPSPTPGPVDPAAPIRCPASIGLVRTCGLSLSLLRPLGEKQCLALTEAETSLSCPGALGATRKVILTFTAVGFGASRLSWRQAESSINYTLPGGGAIAGEGQTRVEFKDVLLGSQTELEVLEGTSPLARLTVRSN